MDHNQRHTGALGPVHVRKRDRACRGRTFSPGKPPISPSVGCRGAEGFLELNNTGRAKYLLRLAERRTDDVLLTADPQLKFQALLLLDDTLDQVIGAIALVPDQDASWMRERLAGLIDQVGAALSSVAEVPAEFAGLYRALQAKYSALQALFDIKKQSAGSPEPNSSLLADLSSLIPALQATPEGSQPQAEKIDPRPVSFLPGSGGAEHAFFPLTGRHARLECEACHTQGSFAGAPKQCESCHGAVKPQRHYTGDCAACHNTNSWKDTHFDHVAAGAKDCLSCHTRNRPANHFPGQCSSCHTTRAWTTSQLQPQRLDRLFLLPCKKQARQPFQRAMLYLSQHQRLATGKL